METTAGEIEQNVAAKEFSLSKHAASGAMVACIIAILGVLQYLGSVQVGTTYFGYSLSSYVLGQEFGMDLVGTEALFVVVTRFLIGFSFSWLPVTAIIALIKRS